MLALMQYWWLFFSIALGLLVVVLGQSLLYLRQKNHYQTEQQIQQLALSQLQQVTEQRQQQLLEAQQALANTQHALQQLSQQAAAQQEKLQQLPYWQQQHQQSQQQLQQQIQQNQALAVQLQASQTRLDEVVRAAQEKQQLWQESEQRLTGQFENLANRIFTQSQQQLDQQNKQSLTGLLTPLREQLDGFRRQIQDNFSQESRERYTLTHQIKTLQEMNQQMAQEAINLTQALKGNNKLQGNWGEVVLTRVLEASGLREGYEYEKQLNLQHDSGRSQPDVVIHLPQQKDVVVDAKMTLVAYERYFNSDDEQARQQAVSEHIQAVRNHIKGLSKKAYQQLTGIRALDYVLLFIPIEPAFLLAIDKEPSLVNEALQHNIMLVSPTTLLVALRTINNLWRYEQQNRNAQQIAEQAAKLYDKFRLFTDDMQAIGQSLDKAQQNYQQAINKLSVGRGNIINQVEKFRQLGVEVKKPINPQLVEKAQPLDEQLDQPSNISIEPSE